MFFINLGKQNAKIGGGGGGALFFRIRKSYIRSFCNSMEDTETATSLSLSLSPLFTHPQLKPNWPICCFEASRNIWRNLPAVQRGSRFMTRTYPSSWKSPIWTHAYIHSQSYTCTDTELHIHTHTYTHLHTHTHTQVTQFLTSALLSLQKL